MAKIIFFHTERARPNNGKLLLTSHNLIDYYLHVSGKIDTAVVFCPNLSNRDSAKVALDIPNNTSISTAPYPEPGASLVNNAIKLMQFIMWLLSKETLSVIKGGDASVSAALEFNGTLFGLVSALFCNKKHAFIVRGNRLRTIKTSPRNEINKYFALFRVWLYMKLMIYLLRYRNVQIWFQGQGYYEKMKGEIDANHHHRLHLLNAVLRKSPVANKPQSSEFSYDLIYTGRVTYEKGIGDLLKAICIVKNKGVRLRTIIIGTGPYLETAKAVVSTLGLGDEVKFAGYISDYSEIERYIRHSKLFVLPSYTEGLSRSMLESMSLGTPVLVSNVGGIPYVIKDGVNGFLVQPASPEALADKIITVLDIKNSILSEITDKAKADSYDYSFESRANEFVSALLCNGIDDANVR